jgi:hypothetical protein
MFNLRNVKCEALDPIIELVSESEKKTPSLFCQSPLLNELILFASTLASVVFAPTNSPSSSFSFVFVDQLHKTVLVSSNVCESSEVFFNLRMNLLT